MKTVEIIVHGKVQDVFFRASACNKAVELEVFGTVENQQDGTVKLIAQGDFHNIDSLYEWCKKGPILAKVKKVDMREIPQRSFTRFSII